MFLPSPEALLREFNLSSAEKVKVLTSPPTWGSPPEPQSPGEVPTGQCRDNALAESFFSTLKNELGDARPGPAGPPPAPRYSSGSKAGTTCSGGTAASATAVRPTTRPPSRPDHHTFALSKVRKGRKVREVPLPRSVARAVERHMQLFAPVPVALPWDDPRPPETPLEAKHRRPRAYSLLVTGRERRAINRNFFNSRVWTPALAEVGVIAPLQEGARGGSRVREPSREHGFHALLCATSAPPRSWRPGNRPSPSHAGSGTAHRRDRRAASGATATGRKAARRGPSQAQGPGEVPRMPPPPP
ncbi:hypothetical protein GCM10023329_08420 [Streptomyces sanyensis]|uniref:Transposase n=1 Tax=Streptomyces sanyensis TaxID=568869 RepID=A0ABP8ZUE9_9ACTN